MSRKARLTEAELKLLARVATERSGETAIAVQARFVELGGRKISKSTVDKKLAEWRKNGKISPAKATLPREEHPLGLEAPWSIGVSAQPEYGITPEATSRLIALWRYSLVIGHVFTIREARWAARLRPLFSASRIGEIFDYSYEYSVRERVCEILNNKMDTSDLDAKLALSDAENQVFEALSLIPSQSNPHIDIRKRLGIKFQKDVSLKGSAAVNIAFHNIPESIINSIINKSTINKNITKEDMNRSMLDVLAGQKDPIRDSQEYLDQWPNDLFIIADNLTPEQDRLFAALLQYLIKGPKWDMITKEEFLQVLSRLKNWVSEGMSKNHTYYRMILRNEVRLNPIHVLPADLLEAVGYDVSRSSEPRQSENVQRAVNDLAALNLSDSHEKGANDER